jgi:hypothetical protein
MNFSNIDQLKAFLKKEAIRLGISDSAAYSTYFNRILLERLASKCESSLVVKGSFSQYVHLQKLSRPVLDIDLSSGMNKDYPLSVLYKTIYESKSDHLSFDLSSLPKQTKNGVYKIPAVGIVSFPQDKKKIIQPINIDFKSNNKVIFEPQYKQVPKLFAGDKKFYIYTPSFEEHLAEKLYIISHNRRQDVLNTRVKDFYDIYELHGNENYDPDKFAIYFQAMLMLYGENIDNLTTTFLNKDYILKHQDIWEKMKKKYEFIDKDVDFDECVYYTRAVLREQIQNTYDKALQEDAKALVRKKQL